MRSGRGNSRQAILTIGVGRVKVLECPQYQRLVATDIAEVIDIIERRAVDCIVTGYEIADGTVLDLLAAVETADTPPILVWTSDGSETRARRAVCQGAAGYVNRSDETADRSLHERIRDLAPDAFESTASETSVHSQMAGADRCDSFLAVVNEAGTVEHVGVGAEPAFGHDPLSLRKKLYFEYVHPADTDDARTALLDALRGHKSTVTQRLRFRDDEDGWCASTVTFSPLVRGSLGNYVAVTTEHVATQATASAELEERGPDTREESLEKTEKESKLIGEQAGTFGAISTALTEFSRRLSVSNTKSDIETSLCEVCTDLDGVKFAWVGRVESSHHHLSPQVFCGQGENYLETVIEGVITTEGSVEPSNKAAATRGPVYVPDIANENCSSGWRRAALDHNFRSCLSLPVTYRNGFYRVVSLYAGRQDAFRPPMQSILEHITRLSGLALNAIDMRNSLLGNRNISLELDIEGSSDTLYGVADELGCRLEQVETRLQEGNQSLRVVRVSGVDADAFELALENADTVDKFKYIDDEDDQYEVLISEVGLAEQVLHFGGTPERTVFEQRDGRMTVYLSEEADIGTFLGHLKEQHTVNMKSKKRDESEQLASSTPLNQLTDRQREVLLVAYEHGYFDQPRKSSGTDVSDILGISQPAFSKHIQNAEKTILNALIDESTEKTAVHD